MDEQIKRGAIKTGLIMEGGAMRGIFTCGVIDVFLEKGIRFDGASGISAGGSSWVPSVSSGARSVGVAGASSAHAAAAQVMSMTAHRTDSIRMKRFFIFLAPFFFVCEDHFLKRPHPGDNGIA